MKILDFFTFRKKKKEPEQNGDWRLCVNFEPERSGNYRVQRRRTTEELSGESIVVSNTLYFDADAKEWRDQQGNQVFPVAWMPIQNAEDKSPWISGTD